MGKHCAVSGFSAKIKNLTLRVKISPDLYEKLDVESEKSGQILELAFRKQSYDLRLIDTFQKSYFNEIAHLAKEYGNIGFDLEFNSAKDNEPVITIVAAMDSKGYMYVYLYDTTEQQLHPDIVRILSSNLICVTGFDIYKDLDLLRRKRGAEISCRPIDLGALSLITGFAHLNLASVGTLLGVTYGKNTHLGWTKNDLFNSKHNIYCIKDGYVSLVALKAMLKQPISQLK